MTASWIDKLTESDSRLHKEDVLKQALIAAKLGSTNADAFLTLAGLCYNPYVTFGVRQVPDQLFEDTPGVDSENPWEDFMELLTQLKDRRLTGNAARDAIEAMCGRFSKHEWNTFCAPVIRGDLRAGISLTTINKICKKTPYEIPVFGCQLATNSEGRPEMRGFKRLEPKLDGVRVLMVVNIDDASEVDVVCYSRNGKVFNNFQHIEEQIKTHISKLAPLLMSPFFSQSFVLDGEVVGNSFQELMRQARRKENVHADDSVFHVFDFIPYVDFQRGHWNAQLSTRITILETVKTTITNEMPNVELVPNIVVDLDTKEGKAELLAYANEQVNAGYEGIMIKDLGAPYECKRNTFWLKWKPVHDYDLTVIAVEEGTGRNLNRMGALVCEGIDDGKHIVVNVGSGYTDEERQEYWDNKNSIIGRSVVVMADAVTQNQDGSYSLRFPRFKTFRDDK